MIKKLFCIGTLAVSFLALVACDDGKDVQTVYAPTLTVSTAAVSVSKAGGSYSFTYTVGNPSSDGEVTLGADAGWISDLNESGGTVSFTASENTGGDPRTAHISVNYSSYYGTASTTVAIAQNAADTPEITVQPSAVAADYAGGTCSFTYSIDNPVSDGEISCTASVDWISDFDCSVSGTVSFTVAESTSISMRTGVISVAYVYEAGEADETVTVVQDHKTTEVDPTFFAGTYECSGIVGNSDTSEGAEPGMTDTWTMKIYVNDDGTLALSGLVPGIVDYYPESDAYVAIGSISGNNILVYPQFTGSTSNGNFIWWAICPIYVSNEDADEVYSPGFYYSTSTTVPCAFVYNSSSATWTSNYGMMLLLSGSAVELEPTASFDAFAPGMTFKKLSDSVEDSVPSSLSIKAPVSHPLGADFRADLR